MAPDTYHADPLAPRREDIGPPVFDGPRWATLMALRSTLSHAPPMVDKKPAADAPQNIDSLRTENAALRLAIRARDDFIPVAAHELRNPMTPLVGQINLLRKAARLPGGAVPDRIVQGIERLDFIVRRYIRRSTSDLPDGY